MFTSEVAIRFMVDIKSAVSAKALLKFWRDVSCRPLRGPYGSDSPCDDDVDFDAHQIGRQLRKAVDSSLCPSALNDYVLALDIAERAQSLQEGVGVRRSRRRGRSWRENTYPRDLPRLILLRAGCSTERRKCEAESEHDREPVQPHGHLGGDGWRGV